MNLLSVNQLSKSYGDKVLFKSINFGINYGDKVALIAKNGSGKSTLFKILQGQEIADSGEVAFRKDIRISFLSQEPELNETHTILEAIYAGDSETVTFLFGQTSFELINAARTRSRDSLSAASGNPSNEYIGRPSAISTSTVTIAPSRPCRATQVVCPRLIGSPLDIPRHVFHLLR